jgi:hypothetical protein
VREPRSLSGDVVVALDGVSEDAVQLSEEQLAFLLTE